MYYFDSVLHPLATLRKTTEDFFGNEDSYLALRDIFSSLCIQFGKLIRKK